jgi:cytochrome b involved in lipid metabolism
MAHNLLYLKRESAVQTMGVRPEEDSERIRIRPKTHEKAPPPQLLSDVAMAKLQPERLDKKEDRLWWIHGNGYDLDDFVKRHPGGREAILLGKGRDCTALVESYHPFTSQHW